MPSDRTELEWSYRPNDFFETEYAFAAPDYDIRMDHGRAVAILRAAQEQVSPELESRIEAHIRGILAVRQLQVRHAYELHGPVVSQYLGQSKSVAIRVGAASAIATGEQTDVIVTDASGRCQRDTRTERISEQAAMIDSIASKVERSPTLRCLLNSYSGSIVDPANELVHLYQVREALRQHYGSDRGAREALGIKKAEWNRIGILANVEPIEQGRHRGLHPMGRRPGTQAELGEAREIVARWIEAFARVV